MLFDSHTHLNFKAFNADRFEVLRRCKDAGMLLMNVGAAYESSMHAVEIAQENEFCFASVGLHPIHIYDEEFDSRKYQELIDVGNKRVRAVGECGIDYWHVKATDVPLEDVKKKQREIFEQHIELAGANDCALIIHGRNGAEDVTAYQTIYDIVRGKNISRAVVHCFGGSLDEARLFTALGFFIGFTGIVTFDTTGKLDEILHSVTLDEILIETDAPYLTPVPYRGKRNEPVFVAEVAKHIARVKDVSVEEVIEKTTMNAKKLFAIT